MRKNPTGIDLIIKGGEICDGSGSSLYRADIAIKDEKIVCIGDLSGKRGKRTIDARGLIVSPGFIDIHGHTDENILVNPEASSKVHQGVTTEIVGNCGFSPAPLLGEFFKEFKAQIDKKLNIEVTWRTCHEYFSILSRKKIGINYGMLVGNSNIRGGVLGYENRRAARGDMEIMVSHLTRALEEGAWGLSSGLIYVPSSFSDVKELVGLSKVVAEYGGIYSTHMRGEGDNLIEALQEAIEVARDSRVRLQISHLKASGEKNWQKVDIALRMIEDAGGMGIDVACDHYPYCASSTGLESLFPEWMREGGHECFLRNLKDREKRTLAAKQMEREESLDWSNIVFASFKNDDKSWMLGKSIQEVSDKLRKPPLVMVMDLLIQEECDISILYFAQSEENVMKIMSHPFSMFGSDAVARATFGPLASGMPHPRAYGTFPRILGHYVREMNLIKFEDAVRKMTYLPAGRLGLSRRGLICEDWWADLTIFNREKIKEKSTYRVPHQYPDGIEYVIINGEVIVERGEHTGSLSGRVLKRGVNNA